MTQLPIYVVATSPHHNEGLMRQLTAPCLLTLHPRIGDVIIAHGRAQIDAHDDGSLTARVAFTGLDDHGHEYDVVPLSHAGPSPALGEDGLEEAYGHDPVWQLLEEVLYLRDGSPEAGVFFPPFGVTYTPCYLETVSGETREERRASRDRIATLKQSMSYVFDPLDRDGRGEPLTVWFRHRALQAAGV